jgi:hypothetical protein
LLLYQKIVTIVSEILILSLYSEVARAAGFSEYGRRCTQQITAEIVGNSQVCKPFLILFCAFPW